MKLRHKILLVLCCIGVFSLSAQVTNDVCADAIAIVAGTTCLNGTNEGAQIDLPAACVEESSAEVWYAYTAGVSGLVSISTNVGEQDSLFNDVVSVYTGNCGALSEVICDNYDEYGFQGEETFLNVTAGTDYYIAVGGQRRNFGRDTGFFCLSLAVETALPVSPWSEVCEQAAFLPLNTDFVTGNNENADTEGIFADELQRSRADVWYEIFPEYGMNVEVSVQAGFSHVLALYSGDCDDLTLVKRSMQGFALTVQDLPPDVSYYVQVSGRFATLEGDFQIKVTDNSSPAVPQNEICATAIPIEPDGECIAYDNTFGSFSGIRPSCAFFPGNDVWFSYTAPLENPGGLKINSGADFLHSVAIYEGGCADSLEIFCSNNPEPCAGYLEVNNLTAGQTYFIQIVSDNTYFENTGSGCLEIIRSEQSDNFLPLTLDVTPFCLSGTEAELMVEISGGQGAHTVTGYTAGEIFEVGDSYFIQVQDAAGCTQIAAGTIECNAENDCDLFYYFDIENVSCHGADDGSITLNYSTTNDDTFTLLWNTGAESETVTGLADGRYTVTIYADSGCGPVALTVDISAPAPLDALFLTTPASSETAADGSLTALPTGGTPSYAYTWQTGQTRQTIDNLTPETYTVSVTDAKGCQHVGNATVGIDSICVESLNLSGVIPPSTAKTFSAADFILSVSMISAQAEVEYKAGNIIYLQAGFHAAADSDFHAYIEDCSEDTDIRINAAVMLGGAYDFVTGLMRDSLRHKDMLPLTEPFTDLGFARINTGGETTEAAVFNTTGSTAITDWILLELRNRFDPAEVLTTRAALLCRNGTIVDTDGVSPVTFPGFGAGQYYLSIRHRNHLAIMSAAPLTFGNEPLNIDFSAPSTLTWGDNACQIFGDAAMLWSGDADGNGEIIYQGAGSDLLPLTNSVYLNPENTGFQASHPMPGYTRSDTNLDGTTIYQGATSDLLPITISVYSNPENTAFQASFPVSEQLPE